MSIQLDRAQVIHQNFLNALKSQTFPTPQSHTQPQQAHLNQAEFMSLIEAQMMSRHLDLIARELKQKNLGFYTIGSSGHEGNAAIGHYFRVDDMALLHYRSGAFFMTRARKAGETDYLYHQLLSLVASKHDPIAGGRHKVFGSLSLNVPPQTSTIASHLPKAVGLAVSITRAKELEIKAKLAPDSVVLCSFGDASCHHSTAQGAFNTAQWIAYNGYPLPLIFICEDNGIGISVATPKHWIENAFSSRPGLHYIACDGLNLADVYQAAQMAEYYARVKKQPVFLHIKTVRLMGHAGSDIESQYLSQAQIESNEWQDPLLHSARIAIEHRFAKATELLDRYQTIAEEVKSLTETALQQPRLLSKNEVMASLTPPENEHYKKVPVSESQRKKVFSEVYEQLNQPRNLAQSINFALTDLMLEHPHILAFGEDVARKGGVYRVTADLMARFGQRRVFDSILDEQTILGHAIGLAMNGFLPIPEIQFLAYFHNAEDQIRGEAASLSFFSNGQYQNPMVLRIAGLAYQKGFGGHFHNDNSIAVLRDIPGLLIACPSQGDEAARMLRTCVRRALQENRVVVFLEPIALYMTKDLHTPGDNAWLTHYPKPEEELEWGELGEFGQSEHHVIVTYGNGYYLACQAEKILREQHQISVKVLNLRWLKPLPFEALSQALAGFPHVLIVDEGRHTGSISEEIMAYVLENHQLKQANVRRITGADSFIPLGTAWEFVLPSRDEIVKQVLEMAAFAPN